MKKSAGKKQLKTKSGKAAPLGATMQKGGVNFSIFSKHATSVSLLLFNHVDDITPSTSVSLHPATNKTYHYWHVFVEDLQEGQLYAFQMDGLAMADNVQYYDASKPLLDPYGKSVAMPKQYSRKDCANKGLPKYPTPKSVVVDSAAYDWEGDELLYRPFSKTVIYEMHVAGFTKNPNSGVSAKWRGTYRGLIEKLPYLVSLGISAIELLPVYQFDMQDAPEGKTNYWGYAPLSFFAPHHAYASSTDPIACVHEFKDMVKACHKAGIEVLLDVVYNHTCEGNEDGPVYSFKGIDCVEYYIMDASKKSFANYSGTGNTLNGNHPIVRRMIIDSLRYWVNEMHVDGFRFDLASILARDSSGNPLANPPVLWDIETDPELAGVKLIAEAWDAGGLYQVGSFIGDNWKEWNGRFRDDMRSFMKGNEGTLSALASKLLGSPDVYGHEEREVEQSINFVTCHDGFTLNDLVSYNEKHNLANGEDNRDGGNDNLSWNCGIEGPTDDLAIETLRNRQVKNFLALTLLSLGAPMLLMGDEVRRTQQGNNNAYCQDNELSWFDWDLVNTHADVFRFTQLLIKARLQRDSSNLQVSLSMNELLRDASITWHGTKLHQPDWSVSSRSIACSIYSFTGAMLVHYMLSASNQSLSFEIPNPGEGYEGWKRWIDTSLKSPEDISTWQDATIIKTEKYEVAPYSIVVLFSTRISTNPN